MAWKSNTWKHQANPFTKPKTEPAAEESAVPAWLDEKEKSIIEEKGFDAWISEFEQIWPPADETEKKSVKKRSWNSKDER